jgi:Flp pilus assembly protein TadG
LCAHRAWKRERATGFLSLARQSLLHAAAEKVAIMNTRQRESGQALVAAIFGLVVLLGAAGLAIDVGYLRYQRRLQQSAADSAALAGAAESATGNATNAARDDSSLNGFTHGINNVTVTVNPAFPFGTTTGVQVQVSAVHPTFFMRIFGVNTANATISTVAVARLSGARNCVYALNVFGIALINSGTVAASGCGVVDNSDLLNSGSINANSVSVHGIASGSFTIPAAILGIAQAGDPLFRLTPPPVGTGACIPGTITGTTGTAPPLNPPALDPGNYCSIIVNGNVNVLLNPGTFTTSGGMSLNGKGTVTGSGVTIYLTGGAVAINNSPGANETLLLQAPTTGALAGILFYQDPGNLLPASIDGKTTSRLEGALYFPSALLNLSNTGALAAYTIAVANSLSLSGTVKFGSDFSSLPGGSPIKSAVLVE